MHEPPLPTQRGFQCWRDSGKTDQKCVCPPKMNWSRTLMTHFKYVSFVMFWTKMCYLFAPPPPQHFTGLFLGGKICTASFHDFSFKSCATFDAIFIKNPGVCNYVIKRRLKIWRFSGFVYKTHGKWFSYQKSILSNKTDSFLSLQLKLLL